MLGSRAAKPTKMYAGGEIVKKKRLPPFTWEFVVFHRNGFVIQTVLLAHITSLDFWHRKALLNLLPQQSKSICVLRRPHGR